MFVWWLIIIFSILCFYVICLKTNSKANSNLFLMKSQWNLEILLNSNSKTLLKKALVFKERHWGADVVGRLFLGGSDFIGAAWRTRRASASLRGVATQDAGVAPACASAGEFDVYRFNCDYLEAGVFFLLVLFLLFLFVWFIVFCCQILAILVVVAPSQKIKIQIKNVCFLRNEIKW